MAWCWAYDVCRYLPVDEALVCQFSFWGGHVWFYDKETETNFTKQDLVGMPVSFWLYVQNMRPCVLLGHLSFALNLWCIDPWRLGASFVTLLDGPKQRKSPSRCPSVSRKQRQRLREDPHEEELERKRRRIGTNPQRRREKIPSMDEDSDSVHVLAEAWRLFFWEIKVLIKSM